MCKVKIVPFTGLDMAVIIPTKDRPLKVKNLLDSLVDQTTQCGRIIIVDSGQDISGTVSLFSGKLQVEYHRSPVQGQIYQRNLGISLLNDSQKLVCFLDDDIVLEPNAFKAMIDFWNICEPETAGVSFTITNIPQTKHTWLKGLMGMSSPKPGRVLRSGFNVTASHADNSVRVQWLSGGATVWKRSILMEFVNREIASKWAICEDVIFSYPIGKKYPLYVCVNANVRHEHVYDHKAKSKYRYYGRTIVLWRLYFVESHPELSRSLFFWMVSCQILGRLGVGLFFLRSQDLQRAIGEIEGTVVGLNAILRKYDILAYLDEGDQG